MKLNPEGRKCSASYCLLVIKKYIEYCLNIIFLGVQWLNNIAEIFQPAYVIIFAFQISVNQ